MMMALCKNSSVFPTHGASCNTHLEHCGDFCSGMHCLFGHPCLICLLYVDLGLYPLVPSWGILAVIDTVSDSLISGVVIGRLAVALASFIHCISILKYSI